jgi:hypothetical protein
MAAQSSDERKRLRTTSPTAWVAKKPGVELRGDPRFLNFDCRVGNVGVCIVIPLSAENSVGRGVGGRKSLKGGSQSPDQGIRTGFSTA